MSNPERILVIDDEDVVREIFQHLLKIEGYQADLVLPVRKVFEAVRGTANMMP